MISEKEAYRPVLCVSGQHRQMLRQLLDTFGLKPDHDLDVMRPDQPFSELTARILQGVDEVQ